MSPLTTAIGAALCLSANAIANTDVYQATLTGTFTEIDFDSVDPGAFADLTAGDAYTLIITANPTPSPERAGVAAYDIISIDLSITGAGGTMPVFSYDYSPLFVEAGSGYSFLGFDIGVSSSPFDTARLALLDTDASPALNDAALPLSLDIDGFSGQRELALFGVVDLEETSLYPSAYASIDTFSAKIIPAPGAAAFLLALPLASRRRRHA